MCKGELELHPVLLIFNYILKVQLCLLYSKDSLKVMPLTLFCCTVTGGGTRAF